MPQRSVSLSNNAVHVTNHRVALLPLGLHSTIANAIL
uniref:Uncharacterized protein n=1 Tax=Octopus bimaculoides TaxID=37653 RepID=A0A0L8HT60_OCTBM